MQDGERGKSLPVSSPEPRRQGPGFVVPDKVKHLDTEQLNRVEHAFRAWQEAAATATELRARARLRLVFLLIRHGALRLGEALHMDDQADLDFAHSLVRVRKRSESKGEGEVQFPEAVMRQMQSILDLPALCELRGRVLRLDQGYVRRRFYERAEACGLPRHLLSPRVIRDSRAIELLRGDIPQNIVQSFLGQKYPDRAAAYLEFPGEEARRIVHAHLRREAARKTSARNVFTGAVHSIRRGGLLAELELHTPGGLAITAVITSQSAENLNIRWGMTLSATVKAPWIIVTLQGDGADNAASTAANVFPGTVLEVHSAEVEAEVLVELAEGSCVCALVTAQSAQRLGLQPGLPVMVFFNAFAVILGID